MLRPSHYQCLKIVLEKLIDLSVVLRSECRKLEDIADKTSERQLRDNVRITAQQLKQFWKEVAAITHYLESAPLAINPPEQIIASPGVLPHLYPGNTIETNEVLDCCIQTESTLMQAYHDILNEPALMPDIRTTLQKHFNALQVAFVQLKMLEGIDMTS